MESQALHILGSCCTSELLGMESQVLHVLGSCCTSELHLQLSFYFIVLMQDLVKLRLPLNSEYNIGRP